MTWLGLRLGAVGLQLPGEGPGPSRYVVEMAGLRLRGLPKLGPGLRRGTVTGRVAEGAPLRERLG